MSLLQLILHVLNAVAPALFLALLLPLLARLLFKKEGLPERVGGQIAIHLTVGVVILWGQLLVLGREGKMVGYATLVVGMATSQWLMSRAWRK